jgi:membrane protease YdiL (CAAX protease family)
VERARPRPGFLAAGGDELLVAALVLASAAATQGRASHRGEVPLNVAVAVAAVAAARAGGASWAELGLEPAALPDGLRAGAATLPAVWGLLALAATLPATRPFLGDERVGAWERRELAYHLLVRVPLATAVAEELLFRSALLGVELRRGSRRRALVSTCVAFGLWHVLPALRSHDANPSTARAAGRAGGRVATVAATVAATALAGAGFAWLRLRSRSVLAPVVAHAGINMTALVAARLVTRRRVSRRG